MQRSGAAQVIYAYMPYNSSPPSSMRRCAVENLLSCGSINMIIRKEEPFDADVIEAVTIAAFKDAPHTDHTEQFIVRALRKSGALSISLVAEDNGLVIGHVAVSPVTISDGTTNWYGLGPISVAPPHQGRGVGSQLMERVLTELRSLGAAGCVVLGDPSYYSRFGFIAHPTLVLPDVPAGYFQAINFKNRLPTGAVAYHNSFTAKS